ncbi:MAG: serine acetyltransferase [Verrucomicrobiota bacterium]|jgi:serine O-acetyltransferase|nr:serine acetyltransferase [Verrucomicrobiota bacterium]
MKNKTIRPSTCSNAIQESSICQTAHELAKLYSLGDVDAPDGLLGHAPGTRNTHEALRFLLDIVFPGKVTGTTISNDELGVFLLRRLSDAWHLLHQEIRRALLYRWLGEAARVEGKAPPSKENLDLEARRILKILLQKLVAIRRLVVEDIQAAYDGDPAALTFAEVQLTYPGLLAVAAHRIAHELYELNVPIIPRIMSEWVHSMTGTDIHPGARIGHAFFIDHATGVVIGETAQIGNHVKLYQGVTLGARSFKLDEEGNPVKHIKRHPTVKDEVVIYANATILGGDTVIGARSIIGSNVHLMESVPADSVVSANYPDVLIREKRRAKKT